MRDDDEFYMSSCRFVPTIEAGFIRITNADKLPVDKMIFRASKNCVTLVLWGDARKPWDGPSFATIYLFKLPQCRSQFGTKVKWFNQNRKAKARLTDGREFDPLILAFKHIPRSWTQDSYARGNCDIIQSYYSDKLAILVHFYSHRAPIKGHPLLEGVSEHLHISADKWVTDVPKFVLREEILRQNKESRLSKKVLAELNESTEKGYELLKLQKSKRTPDVIQNAIYKAVEKVLHTRPRPAGNDIDDMSLYLGVLWGQSVCDKLGWEWRKVKKGKESASYAVCSPDRSCAIPALRLVYAILKSKSRNVENNLLLLYNIVKAGKFPNNPPRAYTWFS